MELGVALDDEHLNWSESLSPAAFRTALQATLMNFSRADSACSSNWQCLIKPLKGTLSSLGHVLRPPMLYKPLKRVFVERNTGNLADGARLHMPKEEK